MSRERFRLPDHVIARRHIVTRGRGAGGAEAEDSFIVLHDQGERGPRTLAIGEREWGLIEGMDGTRDVAGLVVSARARGSSMGLEQALAFVRELEREGLVVDAALPDGDAGKRLQPNANDTTPIAKLDLPDSKRSPRPLEQLPGFALRCDGRGSCCRLYPSVLFSPLDAARARAALPLVLGAGEDEERAFLPERGVRRDALAVALVDGHCAYLGANGHCGVHGAAGALAKPLGCRLFPAAFVDDGEAIRIAPAVECACVVRSAIDPTGGEPLVDPGVGDIALLDPRIFVDKLPDTIVLHPGRSALRAHYVTWARSLVDTEVSNPGAGLLALADAVEDGLPETNAARALLGSVDFERVDVLLPYVRALRARAEKRAEETWRGEADLARMAFVAIASAAELAENALDTLIAPAPRTLAEERLYVRVAFFGHHIITRSLRMPLAMTLRDRATRVVVARALTVVASMGNLTDPAFEAPLALVEAIMRGFGLAAFVLDVEKKD